MTHIPKTWKKTAYEQAEIWSNIESRARSCYEEAQNQSLSDLKVHLEALTKQIKQLERAKIADVLEK